MCERVFCVCVCVCVCVCACVCVRERKRKRQRQRQTEIKNDGMRSKRVKRVVKTKSHHAPTGNQAIDFAAKAVGKEVSAGAGVADDVTQRGRLLDHRDLARLVVKSGGYQRVWLRARARVCVCVRVPVCLCACVPVRVRVNIPCADSPRHRRSRPRKTPSGRAAGHADERTTCRTPRRGTAPGMGRGCW
jgi:hypothetical protein